MQKYKTIIIGSGISGLACAKTLIDAGYTDFKVIGKRIGGRMLTSKSLTTSYGASYITSEYKLTSQYIDKGDQLKITDIYYIQGKKISTLFNFTNLKNIFKLIKFVWLVHKFANRLARLRKRALKIGQKKALGMDPVLSKYARTSVKQFVKENGLEKIHKTFVEPVLVSTVYTKDTNVLYYLGVAVPLVRKTYSADFRRTIPRLTKNFKDKIIKGIVKEIKKNQSGTFITKTDKTSYESENVVIAVPYRQARKFYKVPKTGKQIKMYLFHIVGKREEIYSKKKIIFFKPDEHDITILWKQYTGSDIIFSLEKNPDFKKYYKYYYVVKRILWKDALIVSGSKSKWTKHRLEKGIYLASDYNLCGLEDSYITGVYVANRILEKHVN